MNGSRPAPPAAHRTRAAIRSTKRALLAAAACLLLPGAAMAAWPHERDGVVLGLNLGGGSAEFEIGNLSSDREGGGAGNLRVGYAVDPQIAIGLEGNVWTKEEDEGTVTTGIFGPALTYYPGAGGFFVRGGFGVGTIELEEDLGSGVTVSVSDEGFGFLGALGYEWRLTRKFALGPQFDFGVLGVGDNPALGADVSANYFNFTLGLNWYL